MTIAERSAAGVWGSRTTFVLALTASAIGLGNLWRFAYLLGEQGGAPFLIVYLLTLFLVAAPILIAEVLIGRQGRANPASALLYAAGRSGLSRAWVATAWIAGIAAILILAYHSVVAGWGLSYIDKLQSGAFAGASAADAGREFQQLLDDPLAMMRWQTLFLVATFAVSGLGIHRGLSAAFWLAGPVVVVALGVMIEFALLHGDMDRAGEFLFTVSLYDFTAESILIAMSQAFYTLGIGMGVGMALGAYAPDSIPIGRSVIAVALFDTTVAVAAGVAIFPIVFANNLEPAMGPALLFIGLPYAFGNMPQGALFGGVFFFMSSVVAVASAVALAEPVMSWLVQRLPIRRPVAALLLGGTVWLLSLGCALSFNDWREKYWFENFTLFEFFDLLSAALLLPLACLLTALLVGYRMRWKILRVELGRESRYFVYLWRACLRYVAPPAIIVVMLTALVESLTP